MRTVVFDLDGTLMDTSGDLLAAANACFRQMGHGDVLRRGRDDGVALRGGKAMLRAGLGYLGLDDEALVERWYRPLLEAYGAAFDVHSTLYPGTMEAVARLVDEGYRVAICTNKPEALARQLLVSQGILDSFHALVGADTLPVRKPAPEPLWAAVERAGGARARACLVGDTQTDRDTARAAGVPCILVGFGPGGGDMAALEPEAIVPDMAALPAAVAKLRL